MEKNENKHKESLIQRFVEDERGEFGIKQIAATVAVIVVIGFVVTAISGNMGTWVEEIWDQFMELIGSNISSNT